MWQLLDFLGAAVSTPFEDNLHTMTDEQRVTAEVDLNGVIDEVRYSIDGKDASVALALASNAAICSRLKLLPMCAHVRAMCATQLSMAENSQAENGLAALDALVGCPFHCYERIDPGAPSIGATSQYVENKEIVCA